MKRIVLALLLAAAPLPAQEVKPLISTEKPGDWTTKVVQLKYADPIAFRNLLGNFGVDLRVDQQMKVITLSGPKANVTTAEEAIKQLDVPGAAQKDIDLTVYFVVGSDDSNQTGSAIPSDLQGTVNTLKSTFPFKNYSTLDILSLRTRSGVPARTSGQLSRGRFTQFDLNSANLEGDGSMIQLNSVHAGLRVPNGVDKNGQNAFTETGITTQVVDVKEGQKLVLGRSSLNGPDTALFLILIAKVAQ